MIVKLIEWLLSQWVAMKGNRKCQFASKIIEISAIAENIQLTMRQTVFFSHCIRQSMMRMQALLLSTANILIFKRIFVNILLIYFNDSKNDSIQFLMSQKLKLKVLT